MKGDQVPLGENDAKQEALASQVKRGKGRLPKPKPADLRLHHPLSMGRSNVSLFWDEAGTLRQAHNLTEEGAKDLVRYARRTTGNVPDIVPLPNEPKPGEVAHTMSLPALQDALVKVGPTAAYVHELIEMATNGVITREHEMYTKFQTRFNNTIRRCAAALGTQGLLVWSVWDRVDGVNLKRFGCGASVPPGAEQVEPARSGGEEDE